MWGPTVLQLMSQMEILTGDQFHQAGLPGTDRADDEDDLDVVFQFPVVLPLVSLLRLVAILLVQSSRVLQLL
jgi:hypothetical protein